ncbi:serine/threonine protein kinase [Paludibacterium purpuratum]|uniref:Serine/threonine protein kinase n=2 Tax=Paludibacterium purpuratum TaxID=1144873 RepID=A0A4R7B4P3_9NEIS|nr:serine/threonine protein kinase [Paludibacterium purpuratum]
MNGTVSDCLARQAAICPLPIDPAPRADELLTGTNSHRHYRLCQRLGEGGHGTVYLAQQLETGQTVAIKLLRDDPRLPMAERQSLRARFRRETLLCERQVHPHVVAFLDKGETPHGQLYTVFEYVPGRTLHDVLATHGALPIELTIQLMAQVLDGLDHAHRQGIVHRDLKPRNIMVAMVGGIAHAKILDFGIGALLPDVRTDSDPALTRTGELLGSPRYCSPEQLRSEPPTLKSDLYAWGLVVIECLTGKAVMQGRSVADILYQQLSPVDVALPPEIAWHPLGRVLRSALHKDPRQRAASAAELLAQLRTVKPRQTGRRAHLSAMYDWLSPSMPAANDGPASAVLCCQVTPIAERENVPPSLQAAHDTLLDTWLACCTDIAMQHGGKLSGTLDDVLLFTFEAQSSPCLAAANAALAMRGQQADDSQIALTLAIHAGFTVSQSRTVARTVIRLQRMALPGTILLSHSARHRLKTLARVARTDKRLVEAPGQAPLPAFRLLSIDSRAAARQDSA